MLAHQNPRVISLMSGSSLILKEPENGWMGAWDRRCFMGKETQAQRGQGVVLGHRAMCTKTICNPSQPREEAAPMSPARSSPWRNFVTGSSVQTLLVALIWFSLLSWQAAWFPPVA